MKWLVFLILTICLPSSYAETDWSKLDYQTKEVLDYIANDDFNGAETKINAVDAAKQDPPTAWCLWAALYYKIVEEYRTTEFETEFNNAVAKAVKELDDEKLDDKNGKEYKAKRLQFLASAYGYRGMYRTLKGLWGSAFLDGKRAYHVLED